MKLYFIEHIRDSVEKILTSFFVSDTDVISVETKKILSHPEDRELYFRAIDSLRKRADERVYEAYNHPEGVVNREEIEETIILSDKSEVTLTL